MITPQFKIKNYKEKNKLRLLLGSIASIIVYSFIFYITLTYLLEWLNGREIEFKYIKTNHKPKSSEHNISLSDIINQRAGEH